MWKIRGFEVLDGWDVELPQRATEGSAGYDLAAAADVAIAPRQFVIVPTGLKAHMQTNEWLQIIGRSSLAKKGLVLANSVGLIDSDYYGNPDNDGHIIVLLYNRGTEEALVQKGDRIASAVFCAFLTTDNDVPKERERVGGFGSTG